MKSFFLFGAGIATGFVVAHFVSRTERGEEFFAEIDARAREFGSAVQDGYRTREAELTAAVAGSDSPTHADR